MLPNPKWLERNQPDSVADQSLCTQTLETPSVAQSAVADELSVLESTMPVLVDIRLCRESKQALLSAIPKTALVFMTHDQRILATPEERIARTLRAASYQVSMVLEEKLHA